MANAFRAFVMTIVILVPAAVQAAMWEFSGGLNIEQSVAAGDTTVPSPYFGGGLVEPRRDTGGTTDGSLLRTMFSSPKYAMFVPRVAELHFHFFPTI